VPAPARGRPVGSLLAEPKALQWVDGIL